MEYLCMESKCAFDGTKPFVLHILPENCVDRNNIATLFCPHCGTEMKEKEKCGQAISA